ncbi:alpha glucosidase [Coprinopsis cinerea AmutBmut pab1-1]|nr:alpha glucosidase [Coprinopsis cinerea AmutBmut pab1-1]
MRLRTTVPIALSSALWLTKSRAAYVAPEVLDACPGYVAKQATYSHGGSEAQIDLTLASSPGCNVFGQDIENLRVTVAYETEDRLHVKITDANNERYEVPEDVFPRPPNRRILPERSNLVFNYTSDPEPFYLTVSRRSTGEVLFSTKDHPLIFEDQYLRVKTDLPAGANIYGFGEHTETFRLDANNYGRGMVRTLWSRDSYGVPNGTNLYGNHPVYFEHRTTGTHGVFLLNSNGMDVKLNETATGTSLEYNVIGGVLDFYFLAGSESNPEALAKQYAEVSGLAPLFPYWGLGLHQCRFGYKNYVEVASVIARYREAGIPLETMWTDIDYMDRRLIFTLDPQYFPLNRMREIVSHLHENKQHFIVMTDPAVGVLPDESYPPFERGEELGVWLKNRDGSNHLGLVWPGVTVFPDWFHPNVEQYWNGEFERFYNAEDSLNIDGAWIDMNEPASFCDYPCLDPWGEAIKQNLPPPRDQAPPAPDAPIFVEGSTDWYAPIQTSAPGVSSNVIEESSSTLERRQTSDDEHLLNPPYAIDNEFGPISSRTAYTNIIHANGLSEYDTHNLYGSMMSTFTRKAMINRRPGRRPFIITRSTFAGAGRDVGKWLGDNVSSWEHYRMSIASMLNFAAIFNMPLVGSDVCGFVGDTTEELCARWALVGAFNPFFRNHNGENHVSQEFYVWPKTAEAARAAIDIRYRLLDYLYTGLYQAHLDGTPVLSPVWYKFPKDTETFPIDLQFFYGAHILVSPVTEEGSTSVTYYLPADTWYDFFTLAPVTRTGWVTQHRVSHAQIPMHIRGGAVLPLRSEMAMTTAELRTKPFDIVVAPDARGNASGSLYIDDGETIDPSPSDVTNVEFSYRNRRLRVSGRFGYKIERGVQWRTVKFAGVDRQPLMVLVNGFPIIQRERIRYDRRQKTLEVDVNLSRFAGFEVVLV